MSALSCSTKLEVNAPYRETKVIYALLDPQQPYQFARISKGFLNEGRSATDIAKNNPDSSLFDPKKIEVTLTEIKYKLPVRRNPDGTIVCDTTVWTLYDTTIDSKEPGDFYFPEQLIYKTPPMGLDTVVAKNTMYTISVKNKLTGSIASGTAPICSRLLDPVTEFKDPFIFKPPPLVFGFKSVAPNKFTIFFPKNSEFMQIDFKWKLETVKSIGGTLDTSIEYWTFNSPGRLFYTFAIRPYGDGSVPAGVFYDFIKSKASLLENTNVVSRKFLTSLLEINVASGEYKKYVEVNGTFNAITQSKPIYSNVNNGLGLVASKNYSAIPVKLDASTLDTLKLRFPELKLE